MRSITDTRRRRGAVMMEFLLVVPIYLLLMAVIFSLGEMGVKGIDLAVGDRDVAHIVGDASWSGSALSFLRRFQFAMNPLSDIVSWDDVGMSGYIDNVQIRGAKSYVRNRGFKGSWAWQTASTAIDNYALPPWTRGWLQYAHFDFSQRLGVNQRLDGPLGQLIAEGTVGRAVILSKDLSNARLYNYYTLMRQPLARMPSGGGTPYRKWRGSNLSMMGAWWSGVYKEDPVDSSPENLEWGMSPNQELPEEPDYGDYNRNVSFMNWCQ